MKEELAALKKKRDAGKLTAFQFKKQSNKIKEKYGKAAPSNVGKIINFISAKVGPAMTEISPQSAKAVADRKKAENKAGLANRGKSQGGQKAGEAKKYATAKKVAASAAASTKPKNKNTFKGLDLNKGNKKSSAKTWRDVKSVSAAKDAKLNYFTGRDGKKKIAITAEQLKKKGMSLREYANSLKGKK